MTRLVMTVGGSPLPLLRTLLALRPKDLVALATTESEPVFNRLLHVLGELDADAVPDTQLQLVPAHDVAAAQRISADAVAVLGTDICYTGGTWAMSVGLMRAFLASGGRGTAWYAVDDGDVLLGHDGQTLDTRPAIGASPVNLRQMLDLHAARPDGWRDVEPIAPVDPAKLSQELQRMPKLVEGPQAAQRSQELTTLVLRAVATLVGDAGAVYPSSRILLRGGGRQRIEPLPPVMVHRGRLTVLAIPGFTRSESRKPPKTFDRTTDLGALKEALYAAEFLAVRGGGMHARAVSIATDPWGDGGAGRLWQDVGPDTAPDIIDPADPDRRTEAMPRLGSFSFADLLVGLSNKAFDSGLAAPITAWLLGEAS